MFRAGSQQARLLIPIWAAFLELLEGMEEGHVQLARGSVPLLSDDEFRGPLPTRMRASSLPVSVSMA